MLLRSFFIAVSAAAFALGLPAVQSAPFPMTGQASDAMLLAQAVPSPDPSDEAPEPFTEAEIERMRGAVVISSDGEELGNVVEIVADGGGPPQVIVASGGFFGIGETRVALDPEQVEFDPQEERVVASLTRQQFEGLPDYETVDEAD